MSLDPNYEVVVDSPGAGQQVVSQVFAGYPLFNGNAGSFLLVVLGKTFADGALRWYFTVHGAAGTPYDPEAIRFLQIDPDSDDPIGAYAVEGSGGVPDPKAGSGTVNTWP
ncbi:MAG: hypothetical protein AAGD32_16340 [Planctomycetota bacterium]